MKIWERVSAMFRPRTAALAAEPVCVQDGGLRGYIWPANEQYSYEVVTAAGEKLSVGADRDLGRARTRVLRLMGHFRAQR
jgi:hypothetical protein